MSDFLQNLLTFSLSEKNTKYLGNDNNSRKNVEDHQVLSFDLLLSSLLYHSQEIERKKPRSDVDKSFDSELHLNST